MKKIIAIVLVLMLAMTALVVNAKDAGADLETVKSSGKLVIATSPDFPPFENLEGGKVVGIEIEIMQIVAEKLGVELVIEQMDFDSVLPGIVAGKFNVGVSGITITEARKKNVLFTDPYYIAAQAIVVPEGSAITCKADLAGKKISVQTGTTAESVSMEEGLYKISAFTANNDAEAALVTGKVDAWVIDNLTAKQMVESYNAEHSDKLVILSENMTEEPYAFACAFGSEDLVAEMNVILKGLIDDGTMQAIFEKYGEAYSAPLA